MAKAPRDKANAAPKKQNRKTAPNAVKAVRADPANGQNGDGVHGENGNGARALAPVTSHPVVKETHVSLNLEEQIRLRAFELYTERGGHGGSPEQDWLRAKEELSDRQRIA